MPRVKRSVHARKKRRKVLGQAKGYWGLKSRSYRYAKEQVEHSLVYAYRDRKNKKRTSASSGSCASTPPPAPTGCRTTSSSPVCTRPASSSTARCWPTWPWPIRPRSRRSSSRRRPRSSLPRPRSAADHLGVEPDAEARPQAPRAEAQARGARAVRGRGRGSGRGGRRGRDRADRAPRRRRERRARAARRGLDAAAPGARRRRLPHGRPAARGARDDAGALARLRSRQHRHAAPRRGRLRRGGRALRGLRRPARLEGAARVGRGDLPRAAARVRRRARAAGGARRARRDAAARARPLRPGRRSSSEPSGRGCRRSSCNRRQRRDDRDVGRGRVAQRRSRRRDRALRALAPEPEPSDMSGARLETARLELRPSPAQRPRLPDSCDRADAAQLLGAMLPPDWPQRDLVDLLPGQAALGPRDEQLGIWVLVERESGKVGRRRRLPRPVEMPMVLSRSATASFQPPGGALRDGGCRRACVTWALSQPGVRGRARLCPTTTTDPRSAALERPSVSPRTSEHEVQRRTGASIARGSQRLTRRRRLHRRRLRRRRPRSRRRTRPSRTRAARAPSRTRRRGRRCSSTSGPSRGRRTGPIQ